MKDQDLFDDYTLEPVPDTHTMSGWQVMLVILALGFSLPVLALGAQIAQAQGIARAVLACFSGCILSSLIGIGPAIIGARVRLSSYVILTRVFGPIGGRIINLSLAIMLLGWFANIADILGSSVSASLQTEYSLGIAPFACSAAAIVLMTLTGIFGFRAMERFSVITVPILSMFMLWVLWLALSHGSGMSVLAGEGDQSLAMSNAVSATIGLVVLMAVLLPDFTRYAKTERQALLPVVSIGLGYPLVMMMGAIPAALLHQSDVMGIMITLGVPGTALVILILSTWVGNTGNLYCSTLTLSTLVPSRPVWQLGIGGAIAALIAAWFHASTYFVPFLEVLGIAATPIAAVFCCTYFLTEDRSSSGTKKLESRNKGLNTLIWFLGALAGYVSHRAGGFVIPAPAIEGYVVALALWLCVFKLRSPFGKVASQTR